MIRTNSYVLRQVSDIPLLICSTIPNNECWIYELNSVGKLIWEICEHYNTIDDIVLAMDDYFKFPLTEVQKIDVKNYCEKLKELGMIKDKK